MIPDTARYIRRTSRVTKNFRLNQLTDDSLTILLIAAHAAQPKSETDFYVSAELVKALRGCAFGYHVDARGSFTFETLERDFVILGEAAFHALVAALKAAREAGRFPGALAPGVVAAIEILSRPEPIGGEKPAAPAAPEKE